MLWEIIPKIFNFQNNVSFLKHLNNLILGSNLNFCFANFLEKY
ncbi:hypothetical protein QN326_04070 [Candidatus Phytoplasma asteris]|uniref:Uncharacterized protein n=1 Tax=Candidatus Phytoplasma asteris TaxID=85620 RepID=A0ABZ3CGC4_9MOLU